MFLAKHILKNCLLVLTIPVLVWAHCLPPLPTLKVPIYVNQFGYTPGIPKVAVATDPQTGFNAAEAYTPPSMLQVKRTSPNQTVLSVTPLLWNGGATHTQSGDKLWWVDVSALGPGEYYIYDTSQNARSDVFVVSDTAYVTVLRQALRMFYYQRSGVAKAPPYTNSKWADGAAFLGTNQDTQARSIADKTNAGTAKDVRGGWFDAGDYNKYTVWATHTLVDLLLAYLQYPSIWTDDLNIPESGNGIPDILDEVKWELDWLLLMQAATGNNSVLSKVSTDTSVGTSPPSADTNAHYWGAASTASTACSAAVMALGAIAFAQAGQTTYASTLTTAAGNAWTWAQSNPSVAYDNTGFTTPNPEPDTYGRSMCVLQAAIYLYARTGTGTYKTYVEANYTNAHALAFPYWYGSNMMDVATQHALLYYAVQAGVTPAVKTAIQNSKTASMTSGANGDELLNAVTNATDGYRSYVKDADYGWGSNRTKSHVGGLFLDQVRYSLDTSNAQVYTNAAAGYLHYLLGVNPLGLVYLSNMNAYGAKRSVDEIWHYWFNDGTDWDNALTSPKGPAPGYLAGGANPSPSGTGLPSPPAGQPILKSFLSFNTGEPVRAWEFTEPGIYYQAAFIHLLAHFVANP
jgi:endoglucanase